MDQQAAGGVAKILLVTYRHVLGGPHQVQHVRRAEIQAHAAQHLSKQHQVLEQGFRLILRHSLPRSLRPSLRWNHRNLSGR